MEILNKGINEVDMFRGMLDIRSIVDEILDEEDFSLARDMFLDYWEDQYELYKDLSPIIPEIEDYGELIEYLKVELGYKLSENRETLEQVQDNPKALELLRKTTLLEAKIKM